MIPLGEVNPPPAPSGRELRRVRHLDAIAEVAKGAKILAIDLCILLHIFFGGVLGPPLGPLQEGCAFRRAVPKSAWRAT